MASQNADLTKEEIEVVGWGKRYGESETDDTSHGDHDPVQNKHACTTNTYGPIEGRMLHCDVNYLKTQLWQCDMEAKDGMGMMRFTKYLKNTLKLKNSEIKLYQQPQEGKYYPPGYKYEECVDTWEKANLAVNHKLKESNMDKLREIWKDVTQIEIGEILKLAGKKVIFNALNTCYKKELFTQNGWCFTTDGIRSKRWGFCDLSCKLMKDRDTGSDTTPPRYHRMIWEVDTKHPDKCIKDDSYKKAWFACVKPLMPAVEVPQFTIGKNKELSYYCLLYTSDAADE